MVQGTGSARAVGINIDLSKREWKIVFCFRHHLSVVSFHYSLRVLSMMCSFVAEAGKWYELQRVNDSHMLNWVMASQMYCTRSQYKYIFQQHSIHGQFEWWPNPEPTRKEIGMLEAVPVRNEIALCAISILISIKFIISFHVSNGDSVWWGEEMTEQKMCYSGSCTGAHINNIK